MSIDIALAIAARNAVFEPGLLQMAARPIDAILCDCRNDAVGWPLRRAGWGYLDDAADTGILDVIWVDTGKIMCAAVNAVHDQGQVLSHLVSEILVHDPTDDRRFGCGVMKLEAHRIAFQPIGLQRLVH